MNSSGKIGESHIANWFKRKGYAVLPVYEKEISDGKGPRVFTLSGELVAPDILVFKAQSDTVYWIEAKSKSAFTWHRITEEWTTGIDLHYYMEYLEVDALSPWPVWLFFLQYRGRAKSTPLGTRTPTGLYGGELTYLQAHEHHRCTPAQWGKGGMVYWAEKDLRKLASIEEVLGLDT